MPDSRRPVLKIIVRTSLVLFGLIVISSALLLWRLSAEPIQLDKLIPSIQKAVASLPGGFGIQLEGIELFWDRQEKDIQMRATNVALIDQSGVRIVAAPAVNISISATALMSRVVALSAVELKGVSIHLVRNEDGSLQLGTKTTKVKPGAAKPDEAREFHDLTEVIAHAFTMLESSPDPQHPLSYLKVIDLKGEFTAEDCKLDMVFQASEIDFSFQGQGKGISGDLSLSITSPEALSGIGLELSLLAHGKDVSANLKFGDIQPSRLAGLDPRLEVLKGVKLTLNGAVSGAMTLPDTITSLDLDVSGGAGSIAHERFFPEPLQVRALELKGKADPASKRLEMSQLNLSLGKEDSSGPDLHASGVAQFVDDGITLDVETDLEHFAIEDLATYWPAGLVIGARTWLTENLKVGELDHASLSLGMTIPTGDSGKVSLAKLEGKINWSDLSVFFFRPLPPATGVTGSGTFNRHGFDLTVESGMVKGIAVKAGRVQITGLDTGSLALDVKTKLEGGVADALAVLELPPIELQKVIGFGSAQAGGQMTADFGIALPLKSGLTPAEIEYQVNARLTGASVRNIFRHYNAENASVELHDDFNHLGIKGSLELAGIPITLDWNSNRAEGGALKTKIQANAAEVTAADIGRLGYPVEDFFTGSFSAAVDTTLGSGGAIDASIVTDLTGSGLSMPMLRWSKLPGVKGKADVSISIAEGGLVNITDLSLDAGTLTASGEAEFDPKTAQLTLDLDSVGLGNSLLNGLHLTRDPEHGTRLSVAGGQVDLEPLLAPDTGQDQGGNDGRADADATGDANDDGGAAPGALQIDVAKLDKVFFSRERYLENVSIGLKYHDAGWHSIQASGRNPITEEQPAATPSKDSATRLAPGEFSFHFGPLSDSAYPLSIEVENLGSLLSTTLDSHVLSGGYLTIQGKSSSALLTAPVNASLRLDKFTAINVPMVAQILNVASLNHPLKTLQESGLPFESFFGDLALSDKKLSTELLRAIGDTLGLTITGSLDLARGSLELEGGVVPLYKISKVMSKIPLLKNVLVGDDGEGIIALDYKVVGTIDNPEVSVNPGSLLTPGALRNIFDLDKKEQTD